MNIKKYLNRLHINQNINVDIDALKLIQRNHLSFIPFENLNIHSNKELILDLEGLYEKIILHNRGGICYELNYLLYGLLKNLGFDVKILGGKVDTSSGFSDHLLLLVSIKNKQYLVDAGFGLNFYEPIEFKINKSQKDVRGSFIIEKNGDIYKLKMATNKEDYITQYCFDLAERTIDSFEERKEYYRTNANSIFRKNLICRLEKEDGRVILKQDVLTILNNGKEVNTTIRSLKEYESNLKDIFGIILDKSELRNLDLRFLNSK